MSLKEQIDADLKAAMLGGDKVLTTTLRGLKAAILNIEIAENKRDSGLSDDEVIGILQKEAKKRQESADLFTRGGNAVKAADEADEKIVIEKYLPAQLEDEALKNLVEAAITETGAASMQDMGKVIGLVKARAGASVDGGRIAVLVKELLLT
ncbi:GatB/YqeY domain-containing protein [soil metagenome]